MRRLLLALPFMVLASAASGQHWLQIPKPFGDGQWDGLFLTPYFLNPDIGFTFDNGIWNGAKLAGNTPSLARTTDGAQTWTPLPFFDTSGNWITQLAFVSLTHGYASTAPSRDPGGFFSGGIYETVDQGNNWKKITPDGLAFSGVYSANGVIFASEIRDINYTAGIDGAILISRDDGATWDSIINVTGLTVGTQPEFQWIYGNRDSLIATICFAPGSYVGPNVYLVYSTDLGEQWQSALLDRNYQWDMVALYLSRHSCNIIREHLDDSDIRGDTYSFFDASPPYVNWDTSLLHLETGAWIAGNDCAMYLSYAGQKGLGPVERSTNGGSLWTPDGSLHSTYFDEIDDEDFQNLSVVGYGAVVYASENPHGGNHFLKTTVGGDGTLSTAALAPQMALSHAPFPSENDTLDVSQCSQASIIVTNFNIGCSYATFDSVTLDGLTPDEFSVTSTHYCGCTHVPDTSFITLQPKDTGTRNVTIHYHFTDDEYNQIDTSIQVTLAVKPGGASVALNLHFKSATITVHAGDTIDIPVYLSGTATLNGSTSIVLPFALDTTVLHVIGFQPAMAGMSAGAITWAGSTGTVPLQSNNLTINGETLLGTLRCVVYLSDTLATSVSLVNAGISSQDTQCVALSVGANSVNIAFIGCGDSTLLRFMQTRQIPFSITSVNPNPARGILNAWLVNPRGEEGRYRVLNALGAVEMEGNISGSEIEIDVAPLSNGIYLLRIESQSGFVTSRRFLIER